MRTQPVGTDAKTQGSVEGEDNPHPRAAQHGVEQPLQPVRVRPTVRSGVVVRFCHVILQGRPGWYWEYRRMVSQDQPLLVHGQQTSARSGAPRRSATAAATSRARGR